MSEQIHASFLVSEQDCEKNTLYQYKIIKRKKTISNKIDKNII